MTHDEMHALTPGQAIRIPLSELREWYEHICLRPWFDGASRREKLEAALLCARGERLDATAYLEQTDPAPVTVPATDTRSPSEGGLPW